MDESVHDENITMMLACALLEPSRGRPTCYSDKFMDAPATSIRH